MFWRRRLPEITIRLVGVGHKFFYSREEHSKNPDLFDRTHYVKFDTGKDAYFAYCLWDSNHIKKYYRHSTGTYYSVDRRSFHIGDINRSDFRIEEEYTFTQIGDDWAYIIGKDYELNDVTIVDEATYDEVIADEVELQNLQNEWKQKHGSDSPLQ